MNHRLSNLRKRGSSRVNVLADWCSGDVITASSNATAQAHCRLTGRFCMTLANICRATLTCCCSTAITISTDTGATV